MLSYKPAGSKGALECTLAFRFCSPKRYYFELSVYDLKMYLFKSSGFRVLATEMNETSNHWALIKILHRAAASISKVPLNY